MTTFAALAIPALCLGAMVAAALEIILELLEYYGGLHND